MKDIATFSQNVSTHHLSKDVIEKAKLLLLDSLTAIAYGNQHEKMLQMANNLTLELSGQKKNLVSIFGTDVKLNYREAALINGIGMVIDELDEGNPLAKGHPAAHFLPAIFSLAVTRRCSGKKLLEAFIVNYEISARIGSAIQPKQEIHPHGNWGVFGNGFGIGKLLDWKNRNDMFQASMLSTSFAFPTAWQSVLEGHEVRNVIIGLNNYHTTLLPDLVQTGFTASLATPEAIFTNVLADDYHGFPTDLDDRYYLLHSYFKFYPYCRYCHAPIDASLALLEDVKPEEIKEIKIKTYSLAAKLAAKTVNNDFAGKFSIPFAVASEINNVHATEQSEEEKAQAIEQLMNCITVTEHKPYTELLPEKRMTTVEITLTDGSVKGKTVERATGDSDEKNLQTKVIEKSQRLLQPIFGEAKTDELIKTVLTIEQLDEITTLDDLLSKN